MIFRHLHNKEALLVPLFYSCPFQKLTGIPCPGCNMMTSFYYLIKGQIQTSLYYHAMCIPTILCFILCIVLYKKKKDIIKLLYLWCFLMIVYYIYRMIFIFPEAPMIYDRNSLLKFIFNWI